jgi:hypothetical protein
VIVAGGPSAKEAPLHLAKGKAKVMAVNNSWQLAPWADALYACDFRWWHIHNYVPQFAGLKISQDVKCDQRKKEIRLVRTMRGQNEILTAKKGWIGWGGNGGFHALNLAVQFGAKKIIGVGFDMTLAHGDHWHGKHGKGLNNPTQRIVEKWRGVFEASAPRLKELGVEFLNASPVSTLTAFPKVNFADVLEQLPDPVAIAA